MLSLSTRADALASMPLGKDIPVAWQLVDFNAIALLELFLIVYVADEAAACEIAADKGCLFQYLAHAIASAIMYAAFD
ncbi:hypothetical protein BBC0244_018400 [Bartonella apihabitans]|nr:hypothetical protein BBC0244_018400 [Bartonella apihabitans]